MEYIEAPQEFKGAKRSIFLAGGISGCPDWQTRMVESLERTDLVVLNPRRADYKDEMQAQIIWEHDHLRRADAIMFWFPKETLCPITLYELGAWSMTGKTLFVGVHPEYPRIKDVLIQTRLVQPDVEIVHDLELLAQQIRKWDFDSEHIKIG